MILSVICSGPNILSALQVPGVQNYTKKYTQRIKSPDSEKHWICLWTPSLTSSTTLGKLLNPSQPRCLLLQFSVQFSSVAQLCPALCDPMNRSMPGLPVHHQLPEFTQTHVHRVGWCHPAISTSVVPFSSCPQSLPASGWVNSSHEVAKILEFQVQHQSFQRTPRIDLL